MSFDNDLLDLCRLNQLNELSSDELELIVIGRKMKWLGDKILNELKEFEDQNKQSDISAKT